MLGMRFVLELERDLICVYMQIQMVEMDGLKAEINELVLKVEEEIRDLRGEMQEQDQEKKKAMEILTQQTISLEVSLNQVHG